MTQIKSKWHTFKELYLGGQVIYLAPKGGKGMYVDEFGFSEKAFAKFVEGCDAVPKFVFSDTIANAVRDEKHFRSLIDMKEAGVLHLPYPAMMVEIPNVGIGRGTGNTIALLFDPKMADMDTEISDDFDVGGVLMSTHKDEHGEYGVLAPCISTLQLSKQMNVDDPDVKMSAVPSDWFTRNDMEGQHYMAATYQKACEGVGMAWFFTMLIMSTQGVESEAVDVARLNKNRRASGKVPVSSHTYIRLGRVYKSDGTSERFDSRKSPIPHWRRGHARKVRHGKGRKEVKQMWIRPVFVASSIDADVFKVPEYIVK